MSSSKAPARRILNWWQDGHRVIPDRWIWDERDNLNRLGDALNAYHRWTRWARPSWWLYICAPFDSYWCWRAKKGPSSYRPAPSYNRPTWNPRNRIRTWWPRVIWCRLTGHRGIVYYSSGFEPDNSCKGCGEEIA